jgi:CheY-like chemotaxis protein
MARILVVDDDAEIRGLLTHVLGRAGHEITEATDGNMAIRLHKEAPADLVITDLLMPGKGGIELIVELHRDFPDLKIIALSGTEYLDLACELGAACAFSKPTPTEQILKAVRDLAPA